MPFNRNAAMRKVHILGKQRGYDHDELRDLAASLFTIKGEASLKSLTDAQLARFIEQLNGSTQGAPMPIRNGASNRQLWLIRKLATQLGWNDDPTRLAGFLSRQAKGKTKLNTLTTWEAGKVIEGLKALAAKQD